VETPLTKKVSLSNNTNKHYAAVTLKGKIPIKPIIISSYIDHKNYLVQLFKDLQVIVQILDGVSLFISGMNKCH
jgi:hypothetical protein